MSYIDKINRDGTDYDIQDSYAARSVEGTTASHVLQANEIFTETTQTQFAEFIYRTSAGDASIQTGPAQLEAIYGATVKDTSVAHVDEVLTASGTFANEETTVTLNKNTWRSKVTEDGDYTFSYNGSAWQLDGSNVTISQYGLTVTGTVASGDTIDVDYVKLQTGALTTANPTSFVATGFNQYNATAGYAHVVGGNQYRIAGTYTSLTFSTTPTGTTSAVTVTNNRFVPSEDGYIHVVGGSGNILIALVWSGIMDDEPWSAYETSTIAVPTQDAEGNNLPNASYGMPGIGNIRDSISFTEKLYIQRIGHLPFTYDNLETIQNSGAPYIFDMSDIFYALASPVTYTLADTVEDDYTVNDFGTEEFLGTTVPIYAGIRYGNSLVDKLRNLVDIQDVGDDLTMDGSTIKTAHALKDDVPAGFFSGEATVSGEGTNIELDGTMSAKIVDVELKGDTTQNSTVGKNLWPCAASFTTETGNEYVLSDTNIPTIAAGTYTISLVKSESANLLFTFKDGNNNIVKNVTMDGATNSATVTFGSNIYKVALYLYGTGGFTVSNIQIEAGNTQTAHEAYNRTPNPDAPQDINVVTGTQNILVRGKNICELYDKQGVVSGGVYKIKNGTINIDGIVTQNSSFTVGKVYLKADTTYYFKIHANKSMQNSYFTIDDNGTIIYFGNKSFTVSETKFYTIGLVVIAATYFNVNVSLQIEQNSEATDYEEFQGGDCLINLVSNNNLFDPTQLPTTYSSTTINYINLKLEPNTTYTFSSSIPLSTSNTANIFFLAIGESASTANNGVSTGTSRTKTTDATGENLRIGYRSDGGVTIDFSDYTYQLEKGDTASAYAAYTPIELCRIGDYQDYIYKNGGDWYLHKEIDKLTYNGSESWGLEGTHTFRTNFPVTMQDGVVNSFYKLGWGATDKITGFYCTYSAYFKISFMELEHDIDVFKTWLSTHNIVGYFARRGGATNTKITGVLAGQLDNLLRTATSNGQTSIIVVPSGLAGKVQVVACKKNLAGIAKALSITE